jgi:menaquinol-cytochrome c reductase iron-sulfur subunit
MLDKPELQGGLSTPVGTRRSFFAWVTRLASAVIGLGLAVPLIGYFVSPALTRRERPWVDVGGAEELVAGEPKQLDHVMTIRDGWAESKSHKAVWAVKQSGGEVTVFSPLCTHLGCGYRWDREKRNFQCPCHGSVYDIAGQVLSGPAPRPLDRLPSKIDNGRLLVVYKEFKSGVGSSVEL